MGCENADQAPPDARRQFSQDCRSSSVNGGEGVCEWNNLIFNMLEQNGMAVSSLA
jgi:hypothetical protein